MTASLALAPIHVCIGCGEPWPCPASRHTGRRWRGSPGLITPFRQWVAERCPAGHEGFTFVDVDGISRVYSRDDPLGIGDAWEIKTFGRRLDDATANTLRVIREGRVRATRVLKLGRGNTPGTIRHFPSACFCCGLPEQPVVATHIVLDGSVITEEQLRLELVR